MSFPRPLVIPLFRELLSPLGDFVALSQVGDRDVGKWAQIYLGA